MRRRLYALAFVDEFGPVYAVWTLWFNDNGVTTEQISTAFLLWALVALVLEVPSGAVADRVDRRRLIAGALLVRAGALALWLLWPTFAGLLIGPVAYHQLSGTPYPIASSLQWWHAVLGGLLVGIGVKLGSGCTSGHGVCGIGRLSPRSLIATVTFMATGIVTVYVTRHIMGGL